MTFPFIDKLIDSGADCFLFGGAVRDDMLGIIPTDYDFIVRNLRVEQLLGICSNFGVALSHKYIPGAIRLHTTDFGVVDISIPKVGDGEYVPDGSIATHLTFIDFTMNCIARNMKTLNIYSPYSGMEDIQNKKMVLNPHQSSLRFSTILPLRAARFMSTLGFTIDERTREIFHRDKEMMFDTIPADRLKYEMYRILTANNYQIGITLLEELDILKQLLIIYNTHD